MSILRWTLAAATAALFLAGPDAAPAQSPQPCEDTPAFDVLDFWVGEWTVHVQDRQVGTNRIVKVLDGCAVEEHWTGGGGGRGQSLFYYVPGLGEWRQVWVTDRATATGALKEKRLVQDFEGAGVRFQGRIPLPDGGSYLDRTRRDPGAHRSTSSTTWSGWTGVAPSRAW